MDGTTVDLDDKGIYSPRRLTMKSYDLWLEAWALAGKSLFYMQFLYPEVDWAGQGMRVNELCRELAAMRVGLIKDSQAGRSKILAWLYRFEDEVENQC